MQAFASKKPIYNTVTQKYLILMNVSNNFQLYFNNFVPFFVATKQQSQHER